MKKIHLIPCAALALAMCAFPMAAAAAPTYQEAEEQQLEKSIEEALLMYDESLTALKENGVVGAAEDLTISLDPAGKIILKALLPIDLSWLENVGLHADVAFDENDLLEMVDLRINDTPVAEVNADFAMDEEAFYFQIPIISDQYIRMLFSDMEAAAEQSMEDMDDYTYGVSVQLTPAQTMAMLKAMKSLPETMPDTSTVGEIMDRYGKLIISHLPDAESVEDTLEVEGVSQKCVKYMPEITEKVFFEVLTDVLAEFEADEEIKNIVVNVCGDPAIYDQLLASAQDMSAQLAEVDPETLTDDVLINMNVWYDEAAMSVAGRQIMLADTYSEEVALEIVDAHPVNGDACARYLGMTADDTSLSYFGNGTVDGDGMLDGTYHLYYNTWPIVDVAVSDWDTATAKIGYLNGTAEITRSVMPTPEEVPEEMADILAFVSDYSINATFAGSPTVADCTLSVMNGQDQYATLKAHVDASARPELEAVPEGAEYIDATDEEAMNNFGANFDINALVQRVSDAGVPDEIIQLVLQNFLGAGASEEELAG